MTLSGPVLITGGGGLIGSALCRALAREAVPCVAVGRSAPSGLGRRVTALAVDVLDREALREVMAAHSIETVFHLAGESQVGRALDRPEATFAANVTGTWNVLEASRDLGVRRVVAASSERVYAPSSGEALGEDEPLFAADPYGASKVAADVLARSYWSATGLPTATLRLTNVYGPRDRNVARLIPSVVAHVLAGRAPVILSDGTPRHDYLFVDDAARAYLAIADALVRDPARAGGRAFNVAGGTRRSVAEVAELVCSLAGTALEIDVRGAEREGPRLGGRRLDCSRVEELTGWRAQVAIEDGVARTIDAYRSERTPATA